MTTSNKNVVQAAKDSGKLQIISVGDKAKVAPATIPVKTEGVKTLFHTKENFKLVIEGMTKGDVMAAIKAANLSIGDKSLADLLNDRKAQAADFEVIYVKFDPIAKKAAAVQAAADKATLAAKVKADKAAAGAIVATKAAEDKAAAAKTKADIKAVKMAEDAEAKALAVKTKADAKAAAIAAMPVKAPRVPVDFDHLIAKAPTPQKRGGKIALLLERLCAPTGATKAELMAEFNWSDGGFGGLIHWEPKARGYTLVSEKVDGIIHYHLHYRADYAANPSGKVKPEELMFKPETPVPATKVAKVAKENTPAVKAKEAEPDVSAAKITKRVRIPKADLASAPANGAVKSNHLSAPAPF